MTHTWAYLFHLALFFGRESKKNSKAKQKRVPKTKVHIPSRHNWKHCLLLFILYIGLAAFIFTVFPSKAFLMRLFFSFRQLPECCLNVKLRCLSKKNFHTSDASIWKCFGEYGESRNFIENKLHHINFYNNL